jgi:hypothetical protein
MNQPDPAAGLSPAPRESSRADLSMEGVPPELRTALAQVEALRLQVEKERKKRKKAQKKGGTLGSSRGVETMFRTSYRTHVDLSHLADNKANIMISINGIIISVLIASIAPKIDANPWLLIPTSLLLLGCVGSMVYSILAARPRVTSKIVTMDDIRSDASNILFFGNFVSLDEDEYVEGMKEIMLQTDRLYTNMIRDLYGLGKVLALKFRLLRTAYNVFMVSLILGVVSFLFVIARVSASVVPAVLTPGAL